MNAENPDPAGQAWVRMQAFMTRESRRHALRVQLDLGEAKAELLIRLTRAPMTLREIAQAIGVDPSAATVGVDQLQRRGFVERGAHPDDNRRKLVHLTEAGRRAAATARHILTDPPAALTVLGADDLAHLNRIFAALNAEPEHERRAL